MSAAATGRRTLIIGMERGVWLDGKQVSPGCHRVFLDGRDISNDCWSVDRRCGVVKLFVRDPSGRPVIRRNDLKTEVVRGIMPRRLRVERIRRRPSRLGIRFTSEQEEQIGDLVEAGRKFEAQGVILGILDAAFDDDLDGERPL